MNITRREAFLATLGCLAFWRVRKPKYVAPMMTRGQGVLTEESMRRMCADVEALRSGPDSVLVNVKQLRLLKSLSRGART